MSYIESLIHSMILLMTLLSPIEGFDHEQQLNKGSFPHVYIVPQEELAMAACGCSCAVGGAYLGPSYVGGIEAHTIIMSGEDLDFTFLGQDVSVVFPNTPNWNAVLYHELHHWRQFFIYNLDQYKHIKDPEIKEFLQEYMEEEAYIVQNEYHMYAGIPTMPIKEHISNSMNWSSGENTCPPDVTPIPREERFNLLDLIEFYDEGMIEIYTNKYH